MKYMVMLTLLQMFLVSCSGKKSEVIYVPTNSDSSKASNVGTNNPGGSAGNTTIPTSTGTAGSSTNNGGSTSGTSGNIEDPNTVGGDVNIPDGITSGTGTSTIPGYTDPNYPNGGTTTSTPEDPTKGAFVAITGSPEFFAECSSSECSSAASDLEGQGKLSNQWQIESMGAIADQYSNFSGVIVNGNLTAGGKDNQWKSFKDFYMDQLGLPLFPGLGNRDYEDNVGQCINEYCAINSVTYIEKQVENTDHNSFDFSQGARTIDLTSWCFMKTTITGSLSYSYELAGVHFIQLNNHPTYTKKFNGWDLTQCQTNAYNITSSIEWLKTELKSVGTKPVIINLNDLDKAGQSQDFINVVKQYKNVRAIFGGKARDKVGKQTATIGGVPLFYSGSPNINQYVLLHIYDNKASIRVVDSIQGATQISSTATTLSLK